MPLNAGRGSSFVHRLAIAVWAAESGNCHSTVVLLKNICCDFTSFFFSLLTVEAERWVSLLDSNYLPSGILLIRHCVRQITGSRRTCHLVNVTVFEGGLERYLLSLMSLQELFLKDRWNSFEVFELDVFFPAPVC